MTADTPTDTPAREQRVSAKESATLRALADDWINFPVGHHRFAKADDPANVRRMIQGLRNALDDIAAQAERIATLERENARLTSERDMHDCAATAEGEISEAEKRRADAAEARIADLTRQLAEAERAGMETAIDAVTAKGWSPESRAYARIFVYAIRSAMPAAAAKDEVR